MSLARKHCLGFFSELISISLREGNNEWIFWGRDLTVRVAEPELAASLLQQRKEIHSLAIVEDDRAVGPAVVVGLAEVGEDSHTNSLQSSLVTEGKAIAADLVPKHRQEEVLKEKKLKHSSWDKTSEEKQCRTCVEGPGQS